MATVEELNALTVDDLSRRAGEVRESLFQDKLKLRTGALQSPAARANQRHELARILTVLTQKTKAAEKKA